MDKWIDQSAAYLAKWDFHGLLCAPLLYVQTSSVFLAAAGGRSAASKHFCCLPLLMERTEGTLALLRLALEGMGEGWQWGMTYG